MRTNIDIFEECTQYQLDLAKLSQELRNKITLQYGLGPEDEFMYLWGSDIDYFDIPDEAIVWDSAEFDEEMFSDLINSYLDNAPAYLVFASGVRWNGTSGYMVTNDKLKCFYRDYDVSMYVQNSNGKSITLLESSHDVPMGSTTYILGIDRETEEDIENWSFDEVEKFVRERCE